MGRTVRQIVDGYVAEVRGGSGRDELMAQIQAVIGKTFKLGDVKYPYPLIVHLLDTAQVAGTLWDRLLPHGLRDALDRVAGGRGRCFFMWLAAMHDCGKATIAFLYGENGKEFAGLFEEAGLAGEPASSHGRLDASHSVLTGRFLLDLIQRSGDRDLREAHWILPILAGHHGWISSSSRLVAARAADFGNPAVWGLVQGAVPEIVSRLLGYDNALAALPRGRLSIGEQLALAGYVIVADQIASGLTNRSFISGEDAAARTVRDRNLGLPEDLGNLTFERNLRSVEAIWEWMGIDSYPHGRGTIGPILDAAVAGVPEPLNVDDLAPLDAPLLLVDHELEARDTWPLAFMLRRRFGMSGLYIGVPDDASQKFWSHALEAELRHLGLRMNAVMRPSEKRPESPVGGGYYRPGGRQSSDRCMMYPFVVDTDEQLWASVQQPSTTGDKKNLVMVQFAGLASKVVVVKAVGRCSEVERRCLREALLWLGSAGTPVILEVAGLDTEERRILAQSYLHGRTENCDVEAPVDIDSGAVVVVSTRDGVPHHFAVDPPSATEDADIGRRENTGTVGEIEDNLLSRFIPSIRAFPPSSLDGLFES